MISTIKPFSHDLSQKFSDSAFGGLSDIMQIDETGSDVQVISGSNGRLV